MTAQPMAITVKVGVHHQWHFFGVAWNADTLVSTFVAGAIIIALGIALRRNISATKPTGIQLFFQAVTKNIEDQVDSTMGIKTAPWVVPLAMGLFLFILIANWIALIPSPGDPEALPPPASDVNLTYALALIVIVTMHVMGVRKKGVRGYYHHLFQPSPFMFPINVVEEIAKPLTLALRLFGNIFSGVIMVSLIALFPAYILWAPEVLWKSFDALIGLIQAFIFALLTVLYMSSIAPAEEGAEAH